MSMYCIGGFVYKKKRQDVAEIPNKEFWSSLPGLVKDGFAFSWLNLKAKVKGESGGHGTYDRI